MIINFKKEKLWSKDYIIIMLASSGISFCNYFFFATLPIFAQKLTGTASYSGLMMGVYTFSALAARPFTGILSDKFGRTRLLILGALLSALACFFYNFASVLMLLILIRILHGIGFGIHSTSGGAITADVLPKSRLSEGIGYFGLNSTLATAIAPGIALSIIGNGDLPNFKILFLLAAGVSLASLICDCFITYERKNRNTPKNDTRVPGPVDVSPEKLPKTIFGFEYTVLAPAAVIILLYIGLSSIVSFVALFALDRSLGNIALFFTIDAAGLLLSRLFLGRVSDRKGPNIIVVPGIILLAATFALIPFVHSRLFLLLLAFPVGLAQGAIAPAINALIFRRCSAQRRGTASAAYSSSVDIGYGIGSIMYGFIAAGLNYYFVYFIAAAFAVLSLIVYLASIVRVKLRA